MKKLLFICVLIATFVFWFDQKRKFYQVENTYFTVWDTWGGKCYITPYKYRGITPPKKDYIIAPIRGAVTVFLKNDSSFIFSDQSDSRKHAYDYEFHLDNYEYEFIPRPNNYEEYLQQKQKGYRKLYPYIFINILENYAIVSPPQEDQ